MHRAVVIVDYQNMHLTARGEFTPQGTPTHHSLLHPLLLGQQVLAARTAANRGKHPATLERVEVFRGLPSNQHDPKGYARSQAQRAEWTRDPRVFVTYRPLRYQWENGTLTPREKGVDVLVALKVVELVEAAQYDLVILAAHDTDLEPALEVARNSGPCRAGRVRMETAGWNNCKKLRPTQWHTSMQSVNFNAARDPKQY